MLVRQSRHKQASHFDYLKVPHAHPVLIHPFDERSLNEVDSPFSQRLINMLLPQAFVHLFKVTLRLDSLC